MREKYIDEAVGIYHIFGIHPNTGLVDVSDGDHDVFSLIDKEKAELIIKAQWEFREKLYEIFECNVNKEIIK